MEKLIKNLEHVKPLPLKEQVAYEPGQVVSLTLAQQPGVGMTLFAFDAGGHQRTDICFFLLLQIGDHAGDIAVADRFFTESGLWYAFIGQQDQLRFYLGDSHINDAWLGAIHHMQVGAIRGWRPT